MGSIEDLAVAQIYPRANSRRREWQAIANGDEIEGLSPEQGIEASAMRVNYRNYATLLTHYIGPAMTAMALLEFLIQVSKRLSSIEEKIEGFEQEKDCMADEYHACLGTRVVLYQVLEDVSALHLEWVMLCKKAIS